jgi:biotin operon repressor
MKITDFPKTDQAIIKAMKAHIGIDRAIKLNTLAQQLKLTERGLQYRIEALQGMGCAIDSIDNGYFIPVDEAERTAGITKKEQTGFSIQKAVMGYRTASLSWLDELEVE